jgi:MoxR-like ATPase
VPGLAKTLAVRTLAGAIGGSFQRLQFTPDLLPADVTGTQIFDPKTSSFVPHRGPVFANLVLADEVNRAPAKVQSALLEAMQEKQVTIGDETFELPRPFIVMATQNPIEQEGTYPLPEAQVDRFMLKIKVGYPSREDERTIMDRMATGHVPDVSAVVTPKQILDARNVVNEVYMDDKIKDYIIDVVFASREPAKYGMEEMERFIEYGASPRASIALTGAAKAHAFLRHRGYVTPEDIKSIGPDILRHRIVVTYEAEAEELNSEDVVRRIFDTVEVP